MAHNEKQPGYSGEKEVSFEQKELNAAYERIEGIHEKRAEKSPESSPESARQEALERAKSIETKERELSREAKDTSPAERRPLNRRQKDASFNQTMQNVQAELSGPSRTFSKVIHNKVVEQTSEAAAKTIARPNAILAGSVAAFVMTLAVYLIAKHYGYPLSGFETMGAFIIGWVMGLLIDFFRIMITGRP